MVRAVAITDRDRRPEVLDLPLVTTPGPGQVSVAVEAASVNGIDASVAAGHLWDVVPFDFPVVLGRDFAGTVTAVGDDVDAFRPGDRVAGVVTGMSLATGTMVETIVFPADAVAAVPPDVTAVDAAGAGLAAVTAKDLVDALALTRDDTVLVSGATGGVGAFAVQLAHGIGARVIATARPGPAVEFVRALGAAEAVDYGASPTGVTAVVHAAGDPAAVAASLPPGGRLASAIGATAEQVGRRDLTVIAVVSESSPRKVAALLDAVADGTLRVPVARTYPMASAPAAIADLAGPKLGKLVVETRESR